MTDPPVILITGASGFIGRQVVAALPGDADIHGVTRGCMADSADGIRWHQADLRDAKSAETVVTTVTPTHLIHLAWTTVHGTYWTDPDNRHWQQAGAALLRAFAEAGGRRAVIAGTCAEYTASAPDPLREAQAADVPETVYGAAKAALRKSAEDLAKQFGISLAWPRIFSPFGAGEPQVRLIPSIIRSILSGHAARCSSGRQVRDFIDVRDLGAALAALATADCAGAINLGSGDSMTIADLARLIGERMDRPDLIALGALEDRPGEPRWLIPDLTRMRSELRFSPRIPIVKGIDDSIAYWKDQ